MEIAAWILRGLGVYLALGVAFAAWFVVAGVGRVSPAARGTGWAFRALIAPGSAALWPLLAFELVASRGRGGVVVGRALHPDDVETAMEDSTAVGGEPSEERTADGLGGAAAVGAERFVDPEAETDAEPSQRAVDREIDRGERGGGS